MHVRTLVQQYSSNILRKIIFGSRYFGKGNADGGPGHEEIEHAESILTIVDHLFAFSVTDYFPWLRWITDFDGHEKIMRDAIRTARKYQDPLIDERIKKGRVFRDLWFHAFSLVVFIWIISVFEYLYLCGKCRHEKGTAADACGCDG